MSNPAVETGHVSVGLCRGGFCINNCIVPQNTIVLNVIMNSNKI